MRTWTIFIMLAIFLLLDSSIVATKDCGWVVWKQTIGEGSEEWSVQDGYLYESRCRGFGIVRALTADVTAMRNQPGNRDFEPSKDGQSYRFTKGMPEGGPAQSLVVRFVCLPDTIDPRRPSERGERQDAPREMDREE